MLCTSKRPIHSSTYHSQRKKIVKMSYESAKKDKLVSDQKMRTKSSLELSKTKKVLPIPTLINNKQEKGVKFQIRSEDKGRERCKLKGKVAK